MFFFGRNTWKRQQPSHKHHGPSGYKHKSLTTSGKTRSSILVLMCSSPLICFFFFFFTLGHVFRETPLKAQVIFHWENLTELFSFLDQQCRDDRKWGERRGYATKAFSECCNSVGALILPKASSTCLLNGWLLRHTRSCNLCAQMNQGKPIWLGNCAFI